MERRAPLLLVLLAAGCATLGSPGQGDLDLPTAGVGPFRALTATEMKGVAPLVLESSVADFRDPAALAADPSDPSSTNVYLYAVAKSGPNDVIVRTRADDARSFYGTSADAASHHPLVVLTPNQAWEGEALSGPSAVRVNGNVLLYYAAAGGVGLASSTDGGMTFQKQPAPVLAPDASVTWETVPSAPSVAVLPDGRVRMLYAAGAYIGEAESTDAGMTFTRLDADPSTPAIDPVFGPQAAPPFPPAELEAGLEPPFDTAEVTDPCLLPETTAAGRLLYRVLYTGYSAPAGTPGRNGAIGYAARYGDSGPLVRNQSPVYSVGKHESAPAIFEWAVGLSMLYVQQDDSSTSSATGFAIAAAVAPATVTLSLPSPFASSP